MIDFSLDIINIDSSFTKAETSSEKNSESETIAEKATSKTGKTTRKKRGTNVKSQIPTQETNTDEER